MGSCNPKAEPMVPPKKQSLQLSCKKLKIHLEIKQAKINQQIINGQIQLVRKINVNDKSQRNRFEQLLLAQRVVNGLKYTAVYTLLLDYAISVGNFSSYICQNINDQDKMRQWNSKLYTLLYAAQKIPITSLQDYRKCMQYIDNQILTEQHADNQVKMYLTPQPTPEQMNIYMIQMSQRNNISLKKINEAGHQFSLNFKSKTWDQQFNQKSNQYRNSLPRQQIIGKKKPSDGGNGAGLARKSVSNPFDKAHPVNQITGGQNSSQENDDKVDNNDVSPNITDLMKKISSSRNTFNGQ